MNTRTGWRRAWHIVAETVQWLLIPLVIVVGSIGIYIVFRVKHPR